MLDTIDSILLRDDVARCLDRAAGRVGDPNPWRAYVAFTGELSAVCGHGAPEERRDDGQFVAAVRAYCERFGL